MTAAVGTKLGRYKIRSAIGAGGMGEVFLAEDLRLGRKVALKILPQKYTLSEDRLQRFEQEAIAISALNHPNIITIYEIGEADGTNYIAVEFIDGKTLREIIGERSLNLSNALNVAIQVAEALSAAHLAGIVHRDIKPENIMVRRDGYVKVLDFGLAKLTETSNFGSNFSARKLAETNPGVLMGTMKYLSPEQARGKDVDARSDIFSFGIVLYEMIAGRVPFDGETMPDVWAAILNQEPASIRGLMTGVPLEVEEIINKTLRKDRQERYQTVEDLLFDLKTAQKRLEFEAEYKRNYSTGREISEKKSEENNSTLISNSAPFSPTTGRITETGHPHPTMDSATIPLLTIAPNNLTENFTPIVGREKEIAEIKELLLQKDVRLLTMTGIGGTGKTTLSKAAARELLTEFPDGVFFVEMAAIKNPELVASTIAQPLGVKESAGKTVLEMLKDYLSEKTILLVVDNFEQVVAAAPDIAELISAAEDLKILVTSRALLHLNAEREFAVPPLAVPENPTGISLFELSKYEAVRLFVERARSAKPHFELTAENAGSVADICARLDGLPLAIELAAARVKILSPQAILPRLENRLKLLTGGARDLPARQQTMRGAVEWSYDLLDEDEKILFRRLAIFAGGFRLEAAEAVAEGSGEEEKRRRGEEDKENVAKLPESISTSPLLLFSLSVLDGVTALMDNSLIIQKEQPDGETRFRMLGVVREYALETLNIKDEAKAMNRSHAAYFLALGEEAEPHLRGAESVKWLDRLEEEHDNLRAALRWSLENDAETAAKLAAAIRLFWFLHSHLTEGHGWLKAALERGRDDATSQVRFKLLNVLGTLARFQGDYETARAAFEEGLAVGRAANDLHQIAEASGGLGLVIYQQGDSPAARKFIEEGLEMSRRLKDKFGIVAALNSLGDIARTDGDDRAARPFFEEALAIARELGRKQFVSTILTNLGAVTHSEGDFTAARSHFTEALKMAQELGNRAAISYSLDGFAALAADSGESNTAAKFAGAAEKLRETIGFEIEPADKRFREAYLSELRAALTQSEFSGAYQQGRKLTTEEAITLALN